MSKRLKKVAEELKARREADPSRHAISLSATAHRQLLDLADLYEMKKAPLIAELIAEAHQADFGRTK